MPRRLARWPSHYTPASAVKASPTIFFCSARQEFRIGRRLLYIYLCTQREAANAPRIAYPVGHITFQLVRFATPGQAQAQSQAPGTGVGMGPEASRAGTMQVWPAACCLRNTIWVLDDASAYVTYPGDWDVPLAIVVGPACENVFVGASGCVTGILERQAPASYRVPYVQHLRPVISMSPKLSTRWPKWSLRGLSWLVYRCLPRLRLPQQLQQAQH